VEEVVVLLRVLQHPLLYLLVETAVVETEGILTVSPLLREQTDEEEEEEGVEILLLLRERREVLVW
jgi:hypothetical protein